MASVAFANKYIFFSCVTGAEASFVVNTDMYTKEKNASVSSSKSGPAVAKREVKKVSVAPHLFCLFLDLKSLNATLSQVYYPSVNILQHRCKIGYILFLDLLICFWLLCGIYSSFLVQWFFWSFGVP